MWIHWPWKCDYMILKNPQESYPLPIKYHRRPLGCSCMSLIRTISHNIIFLTFTFIGRCVLLKSNRTSTDVAAYCVVAIVRKDSISTYIRCSTFIDIWGKMIESNTNCLFHISFHSSMSKVKKTLVALLSNKLSTLDVPWYEPLRRTAKSFLYREFLILIVFSRIY